MTTGEPPYKKEPEFTVPQEVRAQKIRLSNAESESISFQLNGPPRVIVLVAGHAQILADDTMGGTPVISPRNKRLITAMLEAALDEVKAL